MAARLGVKDATYQSWERREKTPGLHCPPGTPAALGAPAPTPVSTRLADRLRTWRRANGRSQADAAGLAGVDAKTPARPNAVVGCRSDRRASRRAPAGRGPGRAVAGARSRRGNGVNLVTSTRIPVRAGLPRTRSRSRLEQMPTDLPTLGSQLEQQTRTGHYMRLRRSQPTDQGR